MNNDSVATIGKDSRLVLWDQGSSKDGSWFNYVLIVLGKKIASYRIGREASTGRWAETDGLDRLYREQGRDAVKLLDAVATAISGARVRDIPADSSLYRDETLETLAREVADGTLPQVTAVGRVAKDRNGKQNLERRIARRLPYKSEVGVLARVQSANKPDGWIGRPPRWWLTLTPYGNEPVTTRAADPAPVQTTAPVEEPEPTPNEPEPVGTDTTAQPEAPEEPQAENNEPLSAADLEELARFTKVNRSAISMRRIPPAFASRESLLASLPAKTEHGELRLDGETIVYTESNIPW